MTKRLLLLVTPSSYRANAFGSAAASLGVEVVRGVDMPEPLAELYKVPLALDFGDPEGSRAKIAAFAAHTTVSAILAVDDSGTLLASHANQLLGLPHNDPAAALAARNKYVMRTMLQTGDVPVPDFIKVSGETDPATLANTIAYPVVVKPLLLSGSRGVIRANTAAELVQAVARLRMMLRRIGGDGDHQAILIEEYLPGEEVALEGILVEGQLEVLAIFDKPDLLEGPYFEETIYTTPSRHSAELQNAFRACVEQSAKALGLRTGPVHAEMRFNDRGVWLIEMAGRSIGGLCGSILEFGTHVCLEEVIVRQAVGLPLPNLSPQGVAAGVMMIPIPKRGLLRAVQGMEAAKTIPFVTDVDITAPLDYPLVPLPEGESYLGFIFARADTPEQVEQALREAHQRLEFIIEDEILILQH
jgi:phosphoribosylaminoimidazole carboxylase (NCAIR synthetase)